MIKGETVRPLGGLFYIDRSTILKVDNPETRKFQTFEPCRKQMVCMQALEVDPGSYTVTAECIRTVATGRGEQHNAQSFGLPLVVKAGREYHIHCRLGGFGRWRAWITEGPDGEVVAGEEGT